MLNPDITEIEENIELVIIDLTVLDEKIQSFLDRHIVEISEGSSGAELKSIKNRLLAFLERKTPETKYGAVAEFFIHAHLRHAGFKQ